MRNQSFIAMILGLSAFALTAEERRLSAQDMPQTVITAFQKAYPGAQDVKYKREQEGGAPLFEIEFKLAGKEIDAVYDAQGNLAYTEEDIAIGDLPPAVTGTISTGYPKAKLEEAEKLLNPDGSLKGYEVEIEQADKELEIELDVAGKIVRVEPETED